MRASVVGSDETDHGSHHGCNRVLVMMTGGRGEKIDVAQSPEHCKYQTYHSKNCEEGR